ncbi:DUF1906 domain-containing protein [Microbacterium sp. cx-55]|uniref:glycoside hydrolase domain-containing protein n=1 Tax=Microbacterium sp. cx-55 TaxID=2875948 RepID=UPI001CBBC70A|nr:glycoside hydrolase domain-containing protein [Microbacterium sp. cx-55]MBZ4487140.1 DUF1906 domain-containing protein [Microbacterium sp. cx-55]UGB35174.1 DUF1906 domain-containing protein [Microbacterium sp. cx-55]
MSDPWVVETQLWYQNTYGALPGFQQIVVDGQAGWQTMYALTRALQYELGLTSLSDNFGTGTLSTLTTFGSITATNPSTQTGPSNIVKIAQGALYCKGYNAGNGDLTGTWSATTQSAMTALRNDLGLGATSSELTPKLFKFLLTMDAAKLLPGGDSVIRDGQRALNARYLSRRDFYVVATDGHFLRDTHRALLFALQYEIPMADGVANGNFGPGTKSGLQTQANLSVGSSDSTKYFVRWFHFALRVNGYPVAFSGTYTSTTATHVTSFQTFVGLPTTGTANLATWASLLVSTGDPDRSGTGADGITTLTPARLTTLRSAGYQYFGRYLTNAIDHNPDKCIKDGEVANIFAAGGRLFPLFQTGGGSASHFTEERAAEVAEEAANAAWAYRIPENSVIYFSVDYDAYDWEVMASIIPYFQVVNNLLSTFGRNYRVGIYGPRNVCKRVSAAGLAVYSFVSDMSTGYTGNLGHSLPSNWAFDQIQTLTVGSGASGTEIDKNIVSGRDTAVTTLAPAIGVGNDPQIPAARRDQSITSWFDHSYRYAASPLHAANQVTQQAQVRSWITEHDAYITTLAAQYQVYKALILTPLIWEGLAINPMDVGDAAVRAYYAWKSGLGPHPGVVYTDSSTGLCQIFAETGIKVNNWAVSQGVITGRSYSMSVWQDVWEMWRNLADDPQYNLKMAMLTMMYYASTRPAGISATQMRRITPSQVMNALTGYNGDGVYGRERMALYYLIQRAHESYR